MPHVDEFFAPATLAAAGLVIAIALQPAPVPTLTRVPVPMAGAQAVPELASVVRLPTVEVVAQRRDALAERPRPERAVRKAA